MRLRVILRAIVITALVAGVPRADYGQALGVLRIKVVLTDPDGKATPVPRHSLLISDNPATVTPRLVVTGADGTVDVRLRPGNYTVESDHPVAFHGKAYQWTKTLDLAANRDVLLELTAANAEVETAAAASTAASAPDDADPWVLLPQWQDSVVALWTPITRASGFVIDAKGLIATSQRVIDTAASLEVQLTPAIKVAGRVVAADAARDVAIIWIDPAAVASLRPLPLGCSQPAAAAVASGQKVFTIGVPIRQQKGVTPGTVRSLDAHRLTADFRLARGSAGGPVFTADGAVIGITSLADGKDGSTRDDARVVRTADACEVVAAAEKQMAVSAPPPGAHLPVEPVSAFPEDALKDAAQHRAGGLGPYQLAAADFDVAFITPVMTYGARYQSEKFSGGAGRSGTRAAAPAPILVRPIMDFLNWSDYVDDYPPVLLVRVTPKLVEGFWTTVARGAAQTQGVAIPPIKHFKSGFSRMRTLCDDNEVTPIHPFMLEHRLPGSDPIYEGLYVFDPAALGPQCASVKLVLYSEKDPQKADSRVVEARIVQQISQDFAPYRALNR